MGNGVTNNHGLLTVKEVAEMLTMPVSWVYERVDPQMPNRLPGIKLGKYWRFRREDILEWLERQRN